VELASFVPRNQSGFVCPPDEIHRPAEPLVRLPPSRPRNRVVEVEHRIAADKREFHAAESCAGAAFLVVSLIAGEPIHFDPAHVSAKSLGGLLYLVAFSAYVWQLKFSTPARACRPTHT